tara:strand:+ start:13210 stop:14883 length:1674 start_codon:yes stop_codon:yes gene_type:complete
MLSHYNRGVSTSSIGKGKVQLSLDSKAGSYIKSVSPQNKNIIDNKLVCLESAFREVIGFDSTGSGVTSAGGNHLGAVDCDSVVICNEGNQTAEIVINIPNFDNDDDLIGNNFTSRRLNTLLRPNDFIYLPHNILFSYDHDSSITTASAGDTASTATSGTTAKFIDADASSRGDSITRNSAGLIETNVLLDNGSNHASGDTTLTVDSNYYFKTNDILAVANSDGSTEFLKVLDIPSATTIEVERGILGSTAGTINDNAEFFLYYKTQVADTVVKSNSNGVYQANTLFGYGRSLSSQPQGITMGSVGIKVREPAYEELGMTGQTLGTSTGLTVSTSYDFKITNDADSQQTITIVTDSSNVSWGGTNGLLAKINDAFLTLYKAGTFTYLPKIAIVNGDIRVTSGSRLSTSAITLADGTSNNLIGGTQGRIPNIDNSVKKATKFPEDFETEKIIFDDGRGNLNGGQGNGTIDYNSGAIYLNTFADAEFQVSAYYNSCLSGDLNNSDNSGGFPANPRINRILARSTNPYKDAEIRVIVYDPEKGDVRNYSDEAKSSSAVGKR